MTIPRASWDCDFSINGRFYSQTTTGVQRYGREITLALDSLLRRASGRASIILPANARDVPAFGAIEPVVARGVTGHLWEQTVLPVRSKRAMLNLCNTGPLAAGAQVVCIHDANVFTDPGSYSFPFRLLYRSLLPRLARRGIRLTSVSKSSCVQLAKYLPVAAKDIEVVPNGHEHVFRWNPAASGFKDRLAGIRPFVMLLGSRAQHKNAEFILNQADDLDALGLDLVVVGGSAGIYSSVAAIDRPNIHRLGFATDDDLAFLYRHALCLAFPSRSEGFGLPIVEAMALGCPVVASDRSSMPEVCGRAALLGAPDDVAVWRKHFVNLTESADLRADLKGRGQEQSKKFSWSASARTYLDLFGHSA